jgi:hypothetical protein
MTLPGRLVPLLEQFDFARERLSDRLAGPDSDSGTGERLPVPAMTDEEYLWEPVPGCWSVRRKSAGPGPGATELAGAGEWGRDSAWPHPSPPPVTTIAWRLSHISEMLARRADYTIGSRSLSRAAYRQHGDVAGALTAFATGAAAWRSALVSADDAALDQVGRSTYPDGGDAENRFIELVWWVNQEILHHGAEIALLRDLYRAQQG